MRSTRRLLVAAILTTSATVFATAQPVSTLPANPVSSSAVTSGTSAENGPRASLIVGEWILAGLLLVAVAGAANLARHRGIPTRSTVVDIPLPGPDPTSLR